MDIFWCILSFFAGVMLTVFSSMGYITSEILPMMEKLAKDLEILKDAICEDKEQ